MNKRHYQLFALTILIGAPLLVSMLAGTLPGSQPAQIADEAETARPDYMQAAANPIAALPVKALRDPLPPSPMSGPAGMQASGATLDPTPTLDPGGQGVGGVDPTNPSPAAVSMQEPAPVMPQPAMSSGAVADQGAPPPPFMRPKFREGPLRP